MSIKQWEVTWQVLVPRLPGDTIEVAEMRMHFKIQSRAMDFVRNIPPQYVYGPVQVRSFMGGLDPDGLRESQRDFGEPVVVERPLRSVCTKYDRI